VPVDLNQRPRSDFGSFSAIEDQEPDSNIFRNRLLREPQNPFRPQNGDRVFVENHEVERNSIHIYFYN
jgi:hypothetical protein